MAIENYLSQSLTNVFENVTNPARLVKGVGGPFIGSAQILSTDSVGTTYRLGRIRSSDRVPMALMANDAVGSTTTVNLGLYQPTSPNNDSGAAVSASFFAAGLNVHTESKGTFCHVNSGGVMVTDLLEQFVWQALGLSEDPQQLYDVVATLAVTAGDQESGSNTINLQMWVVSDQ